jgi:hypothetical protein
VALFPEDLGEDLGERGVGIDEGLARVEEDRSDSH